MLLVMLKVENKFFRVPARYAVKPFLEEIKQNEILFDINQNRKNIPVQRETSAITLRNGVATPGVDFRTVQESVDVIDWNLFPITKMFLDDFTRDFGGELGRAMWVKLPPNKEVYPHIDEGTYYNCRDRFHLVVQGVYRYTVLNESQIFIPGDLWWFNNQLMHSAKNISAEDRIVLIFDVKDSQWRDIFLNEEVSA